MIRFKLDSFFLAYSMIRSLATATQKRCQIYMLPNGHWWGTTSMSHVPSDATVVGEVDYNLLPEKETPDDPRMFLLKPGDPFAVETIDAWILRAEEAQVNPVKLQLARQSRAWYASYPIAKLPA